MFAVVEGEVVEKRMEKAQIWLDLPVIALELVAGVATVDQIIVTIISAMNVGLKVVNGHFRAHVRFVDAPVTAAKIIAKARGLTQNASHQGRPTALKSRHFSASMA